MAQQFPQKFGAYTLHQLIARGGMAEIYRATMPGIGSFEKVVAIKKILPHLTENEEYITMLIDEARLVVGLNHANIAQVYDLGRMDDSYYIAMEYVHGVDISVIIKGAQQSGEHIPYAHTAYIMSGLCMGLHVAHHATDRDNRPLHIIHRDISPHNVLISFAGDVKVIDFGVAKASSKEGQTQVGVIKGKLLYMAPEQAMAKEIDGRADLFAAGLVMYKMLTWELPFQGDNEFQIYNNILTKEIVPPKLLNPAIPEELNQICMTLLQRDPNQRYQDGYSAKRDLDRALHRIAPGYTPSRLSRFVEDNFSHVVQEREKKAKEQETAKASPRVREPVAAAQPAAASMAPVLGAGASQPFQAATPAARPPMPGFGPTPAPMTGLFPPENAPVAGFSSGSHLNAPRYETPASGFSPQPATPPPNASESWRTQSQAQHTTTGQFAPLPASQAEAMGMQPVAPPATSGGSKTILLLVAVIVMGGLFMGMGVYLVVSSKNEAAKGGEATTIAAPPTPEVAPEVAPVEPALPEVVEETPPAAVDAAPVMHSYTISSSPEGARVLRDGEELGVTPLTLELEEDALPVVLSMELEGHLSRDLIVKRGSEDALSLTLDPEQAEAPPQIEEKKPEEKKTEVKPAEVKTVTPPRDTKPKDSDKVQNSLDDILSGFDDKKTPPPKETPPKVTPPKEKKVKETPKETKKSPTEDKKGSELDNVLDGW